MSGPHCETCRCETDWQRRQRRKREQEQREREERDREFVRNHSILTDDDVSWLRARLARKLEASDDLRADG